MTTDQWKLSGQVDFQISSSGWLGQSYRKVLRRQKKLPCAVYVYINPEHCGMRKEYLIKASGKKAAGDCS